MLNDALQMPKWKISTSSHSQARVSWRLSASRQSRSADSAAANFVAWLRDVAARCFRSWEISGTGRLLFFVHNLVLFWTHPLSSLSSLQAQYSTPPLDVCQHLCRHFVGLSACLPFLCMQRTSASPQHCFHQQAAPAHTCSVQSATTAVPSAPAVRAAPEPRGGSAQTAG